MQRGDPGVKPLWVAGTCLSQGLVAWRGCCRDCSHDVEEVSPTGSGCWVQGTGVDPASGTRRQSHQRAGKGAGKTRRHDSREQGVGIAVSREEVQEEAEARGAGRRKGRDVGFGRRFPSALQPKISTMMARCVVSARWENGGWGGEGGKRVAAVREELIGERAEIRLSEIKGNDGVLGRGGVHVRTVVNEV